MQYQPPPQTSQTDLLEVGGILNLVARERVGDDTSAGAARLAPLPQDGPGRRLREPDHRAKDDTARRRRGTRQEAPQPSS
eukprot:13290521-Alexandrium_andersonii.AAC.1